MEALKDGSTAKGREERLAQAGKIDDTLFDMQGTQRTRKRPKRHRMVGQHCRISLGQLQSNQKQEPACYSRAESR